MTCELSNLPNDCFIFSHSEPGRRGRQFSNILDEIKLENSYRNAAFESLVNRTLSFKKSNLDHLKVENIPEDDSMTSFLSFFGKKKKREAQFNQVWRLSERGSKIEKCCNGPPRLSICHQRAVTKRKIS